MLATPSKKTLNGAKALQLYAAARFADAEFESFLRVAFNDPNDFFRLYRNQIKQIDARHPLDGPAPELPKMRTGPKPQQRPLGELPLPKAAKAVRKRRDAPTSATARLTYKGLAETLGPIVGECKAAGFKREETIEYINALGHRTPTGIFWNDHCYGDLLRYIARAQREAELELQSI